MRLTASGLSSAGSWLTQVLPPHGLIGMVLCIVCMLVSVPVPVSASEFLIERLRSFATPQSTTLQRVGESLSIEGTASAVLELRSTQTVQQIELFYTRHWNEIMAADQIRLDTVAEWRVLSMVTNELLTVLQLRKDGSNGAYGFLSARRLASGGTASPVSPFAGLAVSEQSVGSREQDRESRVFTMRHAEPPHVAALDIQRGLIQRGWHAEARLTQPRDNILVMRRGGDVLDIVVLSETDGTYGSQIVAHLRTDDE